MNKRAVSPIIATVILVAVTIALAVGVAIWLSGVVGGGGTSERLMILPDSNITGNTLYLHLKNQGTADAYISSVKVNGTSVSLKDSNNQDLKVVKAGQDLWANGTLSFTPVAGTKYTVYIYTSAGNTYYQELTAYS